MSGGEKEFVDWLTELLEKCQRDPGAAFEGSALDNLARLKANSPAEWQRARKQLKSAGVKVLDIDQAIRVTVSDEEGSGDTQAAVLIELTSDAEFYRDQTGEAYADILEGQDDRLTIRVRSKQFRQILARRFYNKRGGIPSNNAMQGVLDVLEARAIFEGEMREVQLRIARHDDAVYVDLANEQWRVIRVRSDGWEIIPSSDCPVRFRRTPAMLPLPIPRQGSDIGQLFKLLNIKTEVGRILSVGFLLGVLRGKGPYVGLIATGEQGTAKSTFSTMLRSIVDPHAAPSRRMSRKVDDLFISAGTNAVLCFDNISRITDDLSDALCILATGGGYAKRELYTDAEETVLNHCRPIILNGIAGVAEKPDLLDRCICVELDVIPEDQRKTEGEIWSAFKAAHADILGALMNAVAVGLRRESTLEKPKILPRMADFAIWGSACETAFWPSGTLLKAYQENREHSVETACDADLVARSVISLLDQQTSSRWVGSASELLPLLAETLGTDETRSDKWPRDATRLSVALKRVSPILRKRGIEVSWPERSSASRLLRIEKVPHEYAKEYTGHTASLPSTFTSHDALDADDATGTTNSSLDKEPMSTPGESVPADLNHDQQQQDDQSTLSNPTDTTANDQVRAIDGGYEA